MANECKHNTCNCTRMPAGWWWLAEEERGNRPNRNCVIVPVNLVTYRGYKEQRSS